MLRPRMACNEGDVVFDAWQRRSPAESATDKLIGSPIIKDIDGGIELLLSRLWVARTTHTCPIAGVWLSLPEFSGDIDKMNRDGTWIEMGDPPAALVENRLVTLLNGRLGTMTGVYAGILTIGDYDSGYEETLVCLLLRAPYGSAIFPTNRED